MTGERREGAGRVTVFCGVSLDGFIARADGRLDWLEGPPGGTLGPPGEDFGFSALMARIDALVMGRGTFETLLGFKQWPYGETPIIVLTHHPEIVPARFQDRVETMAGTPGEVVAALAKRGLRRLYVDGGKTAQAFIAAGLVDEIVVSRLPVLIGTGIPLFGPVPRDIWFRHAETRTFPGGMVQSRYEAARGGT